jgi:hypothetical protein
MSWERERYRGGSDNVYVRQCMALINKQGAHLHKQPSLTMGSRKEEDFVLYSFSILLGSLIHTVNV